MGGVDLAAIDRREAQFLGLLQAQFHVIRGSDHDDLPGAGRAGDHGGEKADRPRADDHHEIAGLDFCPLDHVGDGVRGGFHQRPLVEGHSVREEVEELFGIADVAGHPAVDTPSGRALMRADLDIASTAERADAASLGVRLRHDALADFGRAAVRVGFHDGARKLVTEDHGRPVGKLVVADMNVRSADTARRHLDLDFARLRPGFGYVADFEETVALLGLEESFHGSKG